ncbi:MAG: Ger(x)C family spore germination protein [Clostridia bacterium]|nr:Ger(x)C family spore germination protein [Clostridia bacterium]
MKMIIRPVIMIAICISILLQTGCWDQKHFEEIGFILQMGMELDPEGKMLLSVTSPVVSPDVKGKSEFLHTSSESLVRSSRERLRNVAGKILQGGKIQLVYFSKDLAQKGINEFFEIYLRDPENPLLANVVVVDGSPKEMLELSLDYKDKPRPAFYVNELLLDARRRSNAPEARIFNFSILSYSKTIDPVTPLVRYDKKNIEVIGSALFSGDKLVGELNTDQTMLLTTLMGENEAGEYTYRGSALDGNARIRKGAILLVKGANRKIKIDINQNVPSIDIKLQLKAFLDEYAGAHKLDEKDFEKSLEQVIANSIKADTLNLLAYLKAAGADPIGFGEIVRAKHNQYWKSVQWKEVYKNAVFNVDVSMDIETYGTIK